MHVAPTLDILWTLIQNRHAPLAYFYTNTNQVFIIIFKLNLQNTYLIYKGSIYLLWTKMWHTKHFGSTSLSFSVVERLLIHNVMTSTITLQKLDQNGTDLLALVSLCARLFFSCRWLLSHDSSDHVTKQPFNHRERQLDAAETLGVSL